MLNGAVNKEMETLFNFLKLFAILSIYILISRLMELVLRNYWIANYEVLPISVYSSEGISDLYRKGCWVRISNGMIQIKKKKKDIENRRVYSIKKIKTIHGVESIFNICSIKFEYEKGEIVKIKTANAYLIKKWIMEERNKNK